MPVGYIAPMPGKVTCRSMSIEEDCNIEASSGGTFISRSPTCSVLYNISQLISQP